jgi:hypothetical protein
MTPQEKFLVKGIAIGDVQAKVVGYYIYDSAIDKHYICSQKTLFRYEVYGGSVEFANEIHP